MFSRTSFIYFFLGNIFKFFTQAYIKNLSACELNIKCIYLTHEKGYPFWITDIKKHRINIDTMQRYQAPDNRQCFKPFIHDNTNEGANK
ncbi:hypothetical protein EUGRSUZ_G03108 [Eucalyptus grandis]|uniref:Uncharacterized protein n=2 Tax=Eucalyptus grandis TaxID=71139 RepID=A0ACC3K9N8_EUCGR|nr:hypothetical protein EUGRSUZ_G03108 [Eucalyptus grandis]